MEAQLRATGRDRQKDEEIGSLKAAVARLCGSCPSPSFPFCSSEDPEQGAEDKGVQHTDRTCVRQGKAPPVGNFTGEDAESRLDNWLPTLQRAADWNGWTPDDLLIQLAGGLFRNGTFSLPLRRSRR